MKPADFTALLWLLLVLALIPAVLLLLKRSGLAGRLARRGPGAALMSLRESLVLGPGQRLVAVDLGSGLQRQCLLLGVTNQQVTLLHRFDDPGDESRFSRTTQPSGLAAADALSPAGSATGPGRGSSGARKATTTGHGFADVLARLRQSEPDALAPLPRPRQRMPASRPAAAGSSTSSASSVVPGAAVPSTDRA
jgi:flagellar protein FliO/FliZ